MHCPYCHCPVCENSPSCPRCGLTLEKAAAFFGAAPRLVRGVSDSAGVLNAADTRRIRRAIAAFESRFPQTGFTAAFMELAKDTPGATYAFWVFNHSNPAGELNQGSANRHIFLLVDTGEGNAWITVGYGLEPFIGAQLLQQCLDRAQPHFTNLRYAAGVTAVLVELETVFRGVITALPQTFGLQQNEMKGPARPEEAMESEPAATW